MECHQSVLAVLLCWTLCNCFQPASTVTIHFNSSSNQIPLGTYVTFICTDFQNAPTLLHSFKVTLYNQTPVLTLTSAVANSLNESDIFTKRRSETLTVQVSEANNLTKIECSDGGDPAVFSDPVEIIAIGPPLAPHVSFSLASFTELLLEWEEPFTWPDHDILEYRVNETVNGETSSRTTNQTSYSYFSPDGVIQQSCQTIHFTVSAYSDLGLGSAFTDDAHGLPMELSEIGEVETSVRFTKDGDPEVNVTVHVPSVCTYQTVHLTLKLSEEDGATLVVMSRTYSGSPPPQSFLFHMPLKPNFNYSLEVTASTVSQNLTKLVHFDTSPPFTTKNSFAELLLPIVGGVAGGLVVIIILLIIFILSCIYVQRKSKLVDRRLRRGRGAVQDGSLRDSAYEYIEEYQMVAASHAKNQYTQSRPLPRPDSPYQDMKSAGRSASSSQLETILLNMPSPRSNYTSATAPPNKPNSVPNNDVMHVTPGGSVVFQSRVSEDSLGEGDYTTMNAVGTPAHQLEIVRQPTTLPDNALPYNGQLNGQYKFSEC